MGSFLPTSSPAGAPDMCDPHVVILGAGPAGVGAAYRLRRADRATVTVVEQREVVGGNAGSFEIAGQRVDYGSHRLHPACDPTVLADIRMLLGSNLIQRPRHGRIRLGSRWIHFPLEPLNLLLYADRRFALGAARDFFLRGRRGRSDEDDSFATVLERKLGPSICQYFYFPYAKKIWGCEPHELSATQARRRVSADSFGKLLRKVFGRFPGVKPLGFRHFLYPRNGYGQISEEYANIAQSLGAELLLGWRVETVRLPEEPGGRFRVIVSRNSERRTLEGEFVWSTIPITVLARIVTPAPPSEVLTAADELRFRAMLLVYLTLDVDRFSEYDAHYFPGTDVRLTRLSEPKNYSAGEAPREQTTLCAEIPCTPMDDVWKMTDVELGAVVDADLASAGIPTPVSPRHVEVRRLAQAYPIYRREYERPFSVLDSWVRSVPGLLSFGRQGLFAHDNTHHALHMAYCAAECIGGGRFNHAKWAEYRIGFEQHIVEV